MNRGKREAAILACLNNGAQCASSLAEYTLGERWSGRDIAGMLTSMRRRGLVRSFKDDRSGLTFWALPNGGYAPVEGEARP